METDKIPMQIYWRLKNTRILLAVIISLNAEAIHTTNSEQDFQLPQPYWNKANYKSSKGPQIQT